MVNSPVFPLRNGHAGLSDSALMKDFLVEFLRRLGYLLDFPDDPGGRALIAAQQDPLPAGSVISTGANCFSSAPRRRFEVWFTKRRFDASSARRLLVLRAASGEGRRDVFRALDFVRVAAFVNLVLRRSPADHLRAGLNSGAVLSLRVGIHAAAGAEAHSAASPP